MPATVCASCGTTQGPFVRERDFPGLPVCGFPPRSGRHTDAEKSALATACNARRDARFAAVGQATPKRD
jgi:hypothetical protein